MMRIMFFLLTINSLCFALPTSNPAEASFFNSGICDAFFQDNNFSLRVGYYNDLVYNRRLRIINRNLENNISKFKLRTNAGLLVFNYCNRIELFSTLGVTEMNLQANARHFLAAANTNAYVILNYQTHFSWSLGAKAALWRYKNLVCGAEGQYFLSKARIKSTSVDVVALNYLNNDIKYEEWQLSAGMSYLIKFTNFTISPYAALNYAKTDAFFGTILFPARQFVPHLGNALDFGYAVGMSLIACGKVNCTLEGRFRNEKAFHFNSQLRF